MEKEKKEGALPQKNSPESSLRTIKRDETGSYISKYIDGTFTQRQMAEEFARMSAIFPDLTKAYFNVLKESLIENNFSGKRLHDAVSNLIQTFKYPYPKPSEIFSYDKLERVYTYNEILHLVDKGENMEDYVKLPDCKMWARKYDINN